MKEIALVVIWMWISLIFWPWQSMEGLSYFIFHMVCSITNLQTFMTWFKLQWLNPYNLKQSVKWEFYNLANQVWLNAYCWIDQGNMLVIWQNLLYVTFPKKQSNLMKIHRIVTCAGVGGWVTRWMCDRAAALPYQIPLCSADLCMFLNGEYSVTLFPVCIQSTHVVFHCEAQASWDDNGCRDFCSNGERGREQGMMGSTEDVIQLSAEKFNLSIVKHTSIAWTNALCALKAGQKNKKVGIREGCGETMTWNKIRKGKSPYRAWVLHCKSICHPCVNVLLLSIGQIMYKGIEAILQWYRSWLYHNRPDVLLVAL